MNNSQFRRLVLDTPIRTTSSSGNTTDSISKKDVALAGSLGSRMRSSIPMTPRSIANSAGNDFARQLRERDATLNPNEARKFRSAAAPKGTKLGSGYQDRTRSRTSNEEDEKAVRVKALEDMVKLGQMDAATFEALRDEIIGGEVKDVHLVKGLDWKLLERVKKGEDVLATTAKSIQSNPEYISGKDDSPSVNVDEEFDLMEEKEILPVAKQEKQKRGEMAPPPLLGGKKRNRDEILRELKASRAAATEKKKLTKQPSLGPRFMKLGEKKENSRIEKDGRGREVLITVDEEGRVKRKVKKARLEDDPTSDRGLLMPDKDAKPLGIEVIPTFPSVPVDDHDGDIFEGIGNDYNPLAGLEEDESDEFDEGKSDIHPSGRSDRAYLSPQESEAQGNDEPLPQRIPPDDKQTSAVSQDLPRVSPKINRNYFDDLEPQPDDSNPSNSSNSLNDPTILAALKKASTLNPLSSDNGSVNKEEAAKAARRKKMLESHDRDEDDMDMGFGGSRFEDGEDGEDVKVKLSEWNGDDTGDTAGGGKGKRKRGAKKRKGDANNASDVLKVMERRKEGNK